MPNIASLSRVVFSVAALALVSAPVIAAEPPQGEDQQQAAPAESGPPKGYECSDKSLSGTGPGFKSSQEESEEAAKKDWLDKAKAVYADATWETAKDANLECVKQGLYSKCFATGAPCHPKAE
jgi:hypothetical protein